ncbi:MAG TPA: putative toxin-antitoxin system toxin component, PIN family [Deltaproteobacteria bacterium]|nr:putative toxin-antitoxin system toxin component, PIN family [Deltaproteobacteria bacterium]
MAKIVIDANIIISASFGGKPLEAAVRAMSKHKVYVSREIEQELIGVFSRLSKKLTGEQQVSIREKIRKLIEMAVFVDVSTQVALSRDAKDDHYLSLCKEVGADFFITGDKDLLDIPKDILKKEGIQTRIINPREFLEETVK